MTNLRILFLDDDKYRHEAYEKVTKAEGIDIFHTWSYKQTVDTLTNSEKFEILSLDHDLGDFSGPKGYNELPTELTGTDVADWIARNLPKEKRPERIIIHSWNPDGARRMAKILNDAGFRRVTREMFDPNILPENEMP